MYVPINKDYFDPRQRQSIVDLNGLQKVINLT